MERWRDGAGCICRLATPTDWPSRLGRPPILVVVMPPSYAVVSPLKTAIRAPTLVVLQRITTLQLSRLPHSEIPAPLLVLSAPYHPPGLTTRGLSQRSHDLPRCPR